MELVGGAYHHQHQLPGVAAVPASYGQHMAPPFVSAAVDPAAAGAGAAALARGRMAQPVAPQQQPPLMAGAASSSVTVPMPGPALAGSVSGSTTLVNPQAQQARPMVGMRGASPCPGGDGDCASVATDTGSVS